jgi:acetolactate synthase I/II/III large subunit
MSKTLRGADIVARTLEQLGARHIFSLSGNHIMSIYDAVLETRLEILHTRHEAACVHMADAWGRLTGEPGVALVTGGPGHANAVGALYTAHAAEAPMVLLSGHAMTSELGRGGFQEIRQADMAAPVTKASWTATSAANLGRDVAAAMRIAAAGRPGPVHVSLPSDLLDEKVAADAIAWPDAGSQARPAVTLADAAADAVLEAIAAAKRPLLIAGPQLAGAGRRPLVVALEAATHAPAVIMESVRGIRDATLGRYADVLRRADLIVLLGKPLDFTLQWAQPATVDPSCRLIVIDPEAALIERAVKEKGSALAFACIADTVAAIAALTRRAGGSKTAADPGWLKEARTAIDGRPPAWDGLKSETQGTLHAVEVFRALRPYVERDPDTVLICDGGEFAQWAQGLLPASRRLINGIAGAIGSAIPFAVAARCHEERAPVFAVLGDGTFGFHMSEFDTALRHNRPFVAIVGNDACWNAESQIQLREYGRQRMHGCTLLPTRYDQVVEALGGHGEMVDDSADLPGAIERALASGKPACVNVMIESIAAPILRSGA